MFETSVDEQVVFQMDGSMTTLAGSLEDFESSSQSIIILRKGYLRCRVVGLEIDFTWPVAMAMMHSNRVNLFLVTFDTVRGSNVISE